MLIPILQRWVSVLGDTRDYTELINEEKTLYSVSLNVVTTNALTITSIHIYDMIHPLVNSFILRCAWTRPAVGEMLHISFCPNPATTLNN